MKPFSANNMTYRNKAIKQKCYVEFQNEVRDCMMGCKWPFEDHPITIKVTAAFSTRAADLDNILKPLLDTYQGIFKEFNDNKVYKIIANKTIVDKGNEFLEVNVERFIDE